MIYSSASALPFRRDFWVTKLESLGYCAALYAVGTVPACGGRTDRHAMTASTVLVKRHAGNKSPLSLTDPHNVVPSPVYHTHRPPKLTALETFGVTSLLAAVPYGYYLYQAPKI